MTGAPDLAVGRALRLSAATAQAWLPDDAGEADRVSAAGVAAAAACGSALAIDPATRAALRALPAPADPFLAGADRACVQLALGDLDALPTLLADPGVPAGAVVAALRSAGVAERALGWLTERAESGDLAAATLVLDTPAADARARAAARSTAAPALHRLALLRDQFDEGMLTTAERDAVLDELAALARALGPDGAALRDALGA